MGSKGNFIRRDIKELACSLSCTGTWERSWDDPVRRCPFGIQEESSIQICPWSRTSSLQNCGKMNFCCVSDTVCCTALRQHELTQISIILQSYRAFSHNSGDVLSSEKQKHLLLFSFAIFGCYSLCLVWYIFIKIKL